jgi:hypothetical protein
MKNSEIIIRELLYSSIEERVLNFQQKQLSSKFNLAIGTIHNILKPLRNINAIEVGGRGFKIINVKKLLYYWACHRSFEKDVMKKYQIDTGVKYRSAICPSSVIIGGYEHLASSLGYSPADYDVAIWYIMDTKEIPEIESRLSPLNPDAKPKNQYYNTFILQADSNLFRYKTIPIAQSFVDIFNRKEWYTKDYIKAFEQKYEAILE